MLVTPYPVVSAAMQKIALFGTSADPPTAGHQQILSWLSRHFDRVVVWASDNPFKSHQTPLQHRSAMLRLLIADLSLRRNVEFHPELSSPRTIVTIRLAQQQWQDATLTLVVGSDLVRQLPRWYCATEILQIVELLVVPRPGYAISEADLEQLRQLGATVSIADLTGLPVSSTSYREAHDPNLLTPPVKAYIHREQLYARTIPETVCHPGSAADARRL
jgi:nicotinate-nucleotide adenylyltransferase